MTGYDEKLTSFHERYGVTSDRVVEVSAADPAITASLLSGNGQLSVADIIRRLNPDRLDSVEPYPNETWEELADHSLTHDPLPRREDSGA